MEKKRVSVDELRLGMYVSELDRPWLGTPFPFQGFPITSWEQVEELKKHCRTIFIDLERDVSNEDPQKQDSAPSLVRGSVVYKEVTPVEKEITVAKAVYSACEQGVQNLLESVRLTGELSPKLLTNAVGDMTRSIERNPDAMMLLLRIKRKGGEELNRAVGTSIHMIAFGRFLQFPGERLELLGLAGLLLNIGNVNLPDEILGKKDTLLAEEYELLKENVQRSVKIINAAPALPKGLADIVVQHHERHDGSGYPHGLHGRQITIDGAIAGLVNSYCELTSKRSFTEQTSPSNALNMLYKLRGKLFHGALVEQFIQCIGIYPVGSTVELNTGEIGIVIAQNLVRRLQPRVMLILDPSRKPIGAQVILDLIKELKNKEGEPYRIRRTIPGNELPINPEEFFL